MQSLGVRDITHAKLVLMKGKLSAAIGITLGTWLFFLLHGYGGTAAHASGPRGKVIAYAEAQLGKPYLYGGSGPDSFDCSGLTQNAYAADGISIPRTSEAQWAAGPQTSHPRRGDLVFFTGSPIDPPPGHVGIYLSPNKMIDAYGNGTVVRVESFGLPSSAPGLQSVVGYTDPG